MINNPINELSDDDENWVFSYDSSITDDDNEYDENVDFDTNIEMQRNYYYLSTGMTLPDNSSHDSSLDESSSATTKKQSLSKTIINSS